MDLINAGESLKIPVTQTESESSLEEKWALHLPITEDDYEQYGAVIHALEGELQTTVNRYLEDEKIVVKDKLVRGST